MSRKAGGKEHHDIRDVLGWCHFSKSRIKRGRRHTDRFGEDLVERRVNITWRDGERRYTLSAILAGNGSGHGHYTGLGRCIVPIVRVVSPKSSAARHVDDDSTIRLGCETRDSGATQNGR